MHAHGVGRIARGTTCNKHRQQERRADAHAQRHQGRHAEVVDADANEQERAAPKSCEDDELNDV
jgi:hypothetical protein